MTTAIILAGGKSTRMGEGVDKAFLSLCDKPVVAWSLLAFERTSEVDQIVLVVRKEQLLASKAVVRMFGISKVAQIVSGGARRQESVQAGLAACDADTRTVVIHDAARPCVTSEMIAEVVKAVKRGGAATIGRPVVDTLKRCAKGTTVTETVSREHLWSVQTPQAFDVRTLRDAYAKLPPKTEVTDDCQAVEMAGGSVKIVESFKPNVKVTVPEDFHLVGLLMRR